jgi:hypothetical protein
MRLVILSEAKNLPAGPLLPLRVTNYRNHHVSRITPHAIFSTAWAAMRSGSQTGE